MIIGNTNSFYPSVISLSLIHIFRSVAKAFLSLSGTYFNVFLTWCTIPVSYTHLSAQTLRNWAANGKLHPHHTTVSGYRYYSDEQLNQVINVKPKNRITIGYCRVSSHKQKGDLERQIDNVKTYLLAKGQPFEIISDIGSGINYKKKGLQELIRRISQNQVEKVVVLYKDRLLRFGFELIEYIASLYNCEIEIIDNTEKSEQQELVEDVYKRQEDISSE